LKQAALFSEENDPFLRIVQFELYDFGFEMRESCDFEIPDFLIPDLRFHDFKF